MRVLVRLFRWPSLLATALLSAVILGCVAAVAPMFLTAAGSEIFRAHATRLQSAEPLQIRDFNIFVAEFADYRDRVLAEATPAGLTAPVRTVWGEPIEIVGPDGRDNIVRAISRSGALESVELLTGAPKKGVWLSDYNAGEMGVEAGDVIVVQGLEESIELEVTGLYRDPLKDPVSDFWAPIRDVVYPDPGEDTRPPAPLIVDRATFFSLARELGDDAGEYRWEFGLTTIDLTLPEVEGLSDRIEAFNAERLDATSELGASFLRANLVSQVSGWADITGEAVGSIRGPVETLTLGGTIVAALIVAATAFFTVHRRRTEFNLLHARGISPVRLGLRSTGEALVPLIAGAAAGWVLAVVFVRTVGPPGLVARSALVDGALRVAWAAAAAALLFGIAASVAVRLLAHEGFGKLQRAARAPWEPIVLVLAAAAFYELDSRSGDPGAVGSLDRLTILFPILFIVGAAGLAARGLRRLLPRLRSGGASLPASLYLAARRLGAAVRSASALVTASGVAVGMFFYAATLSTSVEATANQRALLQTGAEVAASVSRFPEAVASERFDSTPVIKLPGAALLPDDVPVDILAVDPESFAAAAYWDSELADASVDELMAALASPSGEGIAAVVAGDATDADLLSVSSYDLPIAVQGRAGRFPGMVGQRPTVVVPLAELTAAVESAGGSVSGIAGREFQVWADGNAAELERTLEAEGLAPFALLTAAELRDTPAYLALTWTFGLMKALGVLIGVIALLGTLLYLQTRQKEREVSYALGRRMGLTRSSHRAAIGLEIGAMLCIALLTGAALATVAAIVMHDRIQIFVEGGAVPLLRIPVMLLTGAAAALLAFAWVSAWLVQRAADRMDVAQVMRLAR